MKFTTYLKDNDKALLVCFSGALIFTVLLFAFGLGTGEVVLLWLCFLIILAGYFCLDYWGKRKRFEMLLSVMQTLDKKYLFAEVVENPHSTLEQDYFLLMKMALKSMTDEVSLTKRLSLEYREYIEQWVHEIKVPITGIKLICENNKNHDVRKIMSQIEMVERNVECVLFYARLGSVEKDYLIREIALKNCVMNVLARNKQFLIQNGVRVDTDALSVNDSVYSDNKWIEFIINQIILNSIKYKKDDAPVVTVSFADHGEYAYLSITDNGMGIRQSEISRIFDKGFVGSNGRTGKHSTGMGLYLCKQLCTKLGIDIDAESEVGRYTTVRLYFSKNNCLST